MVKCQHCGKNIGLLAIRYTWIDKTNKIAIHDKCLEEYEKKKPEKKLENPEEKLEEQEKPKENKRTKKKKKEKKQI